MALPRIKYGDVFEIATNKGFGYFQCVKEAPATECETIRIFPGTYENIEEANLENLVNEKELYFIQFTLKYAVKKKCIKLIGNFKVPEQVVVPQYYRDKHIVRGEFISWHIIDSETLKIRSVKELSDDEKKLSQSGIWNDTLLAERMAEGWTLDKWV